MLDSLKRLLSGSTPPAEEPLPAVTRLDQLAGVTFSETRTDAGVNLAVLIQSDPHSTRIVYETRGDFYPGSKALVNEQSTSSPEAQAALGRVFNEARKHHPKIRHDYSHFGPLADWVEPLQMVHAKLVGRTYHCGYTCSGERYVHGENGDRVLQRTAGSHDYDTCTLPFSGLSVGDDMIARLFGKSYSFEIIGSITLPATFYVIDNDKLPLVEAVKRIAPREDDGFDIQTKFGSESAANAFDYAGPTICVEFGSGRTSFPFDGKSQKNTIASGVFPSKRSYIAASPHFGPLPLLRDLLEIATPRFDILHNDRWSSYPSTGGLCWVSVQNTPRFSYEVVLKHEK